ncbi:MAG TPA: NAD-dependent epimerase/dehydratase family protein, partial [Candidatus Babeliales bacterium]|nr:NAD-dependent epimerase/dehydratase family protein [Candidatus Babeliales bacterium]
MQNFYQNQPVLVTGGAGFIGSHVTELLVQAGASVTVLDNLSTGTRDNLTTVSNQIKLLIQDLRDFPALLNLLQQQQFSAIFHLAAATSVPESQLDPVLYHEINVTGTLNLLTALQQVNAQQTRLIFSSSSAVYGQRHDLCRETDACAPTSVYGLSKLIGEQYCQLFSQSFSLPTICLRYFNVYGPRQNPAGAYAGVYAKFQHSLAHNLPITIYG